MKTARFFKVFFVVSLIFFTGLTARVFASSIGTGNIGNLESGPTYFFEPSAPQHTIAKFSDPTALNYNKTGAMALNVVLREIQAGLVGDPPVKLPSGQVFKGSTGAVGFFSNQIAFMTTTPVISGGDYIAYNFNKLTVPGVRPTYAASQVGGVGYRSLFPVLQLWTLTRNIAYLFFAIIFVVVGLMIILGRKLDPKTVLTVQAALPKIIISLVLVTFSYAIAGFVVDIMYVLIALIFAVLDPLLKNNPTGTGQDLFNSIKNGEILFLFFAKTPWIGAFQGITEATGQISEQIFSGILGGVVSHLLGQGAGVIIGLILAIAVFYSLFKIWLKLVMTYIQLILAVIVGPFLIMMDAIPKPGQSHFSSWLKGLLGNAMIYPVTIMMLLISMIITAGVGASGIGDGSFIAPLTGIGNVGVAQAIIGIGMLLSIPAFLDKVPGWMGVGKDGGLSGLTNSWQDSLKSPYPMQIAGAAAQAKKKAFDEKVVKAMTERPKKGDLPEMPREDVMRYANAPTPLQPVDPRKDLSDYMDYYNTLKPDDQTRFIRKIANERLAYNSASPAQQAQAIAQLQSELAEYQAQLHMHTTANAMMQDFISKSAKELETRRKESEWKKGGLLSKLGLTNERKEDIGDKTAIAVGKAIGAVPGLDLANKAAGIK